MLADYCGNIIEEVTNGWVTETSFKHE